MAAAEPVTTDCGDGITAIDTGLLRPLFDASHLIVENGRAAFIDCGVNASIPLLLAALGERNIDAADVDYLFLTHVHLDHAGGAGLLMKSLPNAVAVLHPRGAPHMIDPARLIKGATAVYGEEEYRRQYGDIEAIPAERVSIAANGEIFRLGGRPLSSLYTEGHARHHHCIVDPASRSVFTGDSFGISYRELDTDRGAFIYPTTTPVHFDPGEAHKAVDRICGEKPRQLFLTHYSRVSEVERLAADMHRRIDGFVDIALGNASAKRRTDRMRAAMQAYLVEEIRAHGHRGSDAQIKETIAPDVLLNTMGLEFWLDHRT